MAHEWRSVQAVHDEFDLSSVEVRRLAEDFGSSGLVIDGSISRLSVAYLHGNSPAAHSQL